MAPRSSLPLLVRLALAAVLIPVSVVAQSVGPGLSGIVRYEAGTPAAGVDVSVRGPVTRAVRTDASGRFSFPELPSGAYVVRAEGPAASPTERRVEIGTEPTTLDLVVTRVAMALEGLEVVTTVRGARTASSLPVKVEVLDETELRTQRTLATNPTEMLANLVPSFSPGRQKLTSSGESFRGRRPLFLVDGIPQSNPLRDGRRDGFTIGADMIERVEIVFGANAVQGLGATGGIVNFITVAPPRSGRLEQRASVGTTVGSDLNGNGLGWRAHYQAGRRFGDVDALAAVTYERRGLQFDGRGRAIAIDNVQGDVADSESRSVFAKVGWEPAPGRRLQLTVSDFHLAQNGGFASVDGDRAIGLPATSIPGNPEGVEPVNDVTAVALDWEQPALGGVLSAKAYGQDFSALFGGGRFGTFQDPAIAPEGELFDQSENNSQKLGTRLTWAGADRLEGLIDVIAGFDVLRDETFQRLVQTDRNWVPTTRFYNYAPFVQADLEPWSGTTLSAGIRWELAELDVPDFTTLAGNRADRMPVQVRGGSPGFDAPLFNVGAVVSPASGLRFYGTVAQAFTMPDVGRVLRGVSEEGTSVDQFLDLQPVETDNLEAGAAWGTGSTRVSATWFRSDAELGSRLVPNADGIFEVRREPTRTSGWEFTGRVDPSSTLSVTAGYSLLEGTFDGDLDGTYESDLGAADIGPNRLNLGVDVTPEGPVTARLQALRYFDREFRDAADAVTARFDGYTTVDAAVSFRLPGPTVTLAVSNLLDTQYISYYGQAATDRNDRFFAGRGRTLTLTLDAGF